MNKSSGRGRIGRQSQSASLLSVCSIEKSSGRGGIGTQSQRGLETGNVKTLIEKRKPQTNKRRKIFFIYNPF